MREAPVELEGAVVWSGSWLVSSGACIDWVGGYPR